jgi:hypothetical protein
LLSETSGTIYHLWLHFCCTFLLIFCGHMQIVKLVFSDSFKCPLSHDIHHNLIIGRRHNENLPCHKLVKTGCCNLLAKILCTLLLYRILNMIFRLSTTIRFIMRNGRVIGQMQKILRGFKVRCFTGSEI